MAYINILIDEEVQTLYSIPIFRGSMPNKVKKEIDLQEITALLMENPKLYFDQKSTI